MYAGPPGPAVRTTSKLVPWRLRPSGNVASPVRAGIQRYQARREGGGGDHADAVGRARVRAEGERRPRGRPLRPAHVRGAARAGGPDDLEAGAVAATAERERRVAGPVGDPAVPDVARGLSLR